MRQTRPYGGFLVMGTRSHPTQNLTIWTFSGHVPYPLCRWGAVDGPLSAPHEEIASYPPVGWGSRDAGVEQVSQRSISSCWPLRESGRNCVGGGGDRGWCRPSLMNHRAPEVSRGRAVTVWI